MPQRFNPRLDARNALATEIVSASGIRAHELLTLGRPAEQPPDDRRGQSRLTGTAAEGMKFAGRDAAPAPGRTGRCGPPRGFRLPASRRARVDRGPMAQAAAPSLPRLSHNVAAPPRGVGSGRGNPVVTGR